MKTIILLSFVFATVVIATQALVVRPGRVQPGRPSFPTFPGQGPFHQRPTFPKPYRFRRSPDVEGTVTGTVVQPLEGPERQPSVSVDYNHKIYEGQLGDISLTGGVAKNPGHRVEGTVGIQASIPLGPRSEPRSQPRSEPRNEPRRPDLFPPTAWDIDEYGREKVIP